MAGDGRDEALEAVVVQQNKRTKRPMKTVITCKLDVMKIDKKRLFEGKNGAKYLDLTLIETENSKYGDDFMCVQSVSKEERLRGEKGPILGNARYMRTERQPAKPEAKSETKDEENCDVPF